MTRILEVADLNVSLPLDSGMLHAVRGVSFHIDAQEILGIVGESGCGKSMAALAIMDLLPRRAERRIGRLRFGGENIASFSSRQMSSLRGDRITMIFQEPMTSLNPVYTIGNQLEEVYRRHRGGRREDARRGALMLLERVGIPAPAHRLGQYPHQLSGGLRQRVMIAMALMCEPDLIICDEPTTALDVTIQAQVLRLLKELQRDFGMAIVLITHDLGVVARMADRILVMYAGEVVEHGSTQAIFSRPCHPYTQGLLHCLLQPGKQKANLRLGTIPGVVPSLIGKIKGCAFSNRCPVILPNCESQSIEFADVEPGHAFRCLVPSEQSLRRFNEVIE